MKLSVPANGPVMQGLREVTNDELVFLHAVQAGVPDYTESLLGRLGCVPRASDTGGSAVAGSGARCIRQV